MKKMRITFIAFAALGISFSCSDDFLDRQPLDEVVSTNFYKTQEDAQEALVAIYDVLGYQSTPAVSWSPYMTVSDILSDDAFAGGADANDGLDENELNSFNIPPTNQIIRSVWTINYTGIYRANLLLERIEGIDADEDFKNRAIAEAKFLRAYFYFQQVRLFENIPLLLETISGPSEYIQPQSAPEDVYDQIALDLIESIDVLPESIPSVELGRVTKWSAIGLLGRVYLFYNGVYGNDLNAGDQTIGSSEVLNLLEELITDSGHDLLANYDDVWREANEFSVESVFEISHGDSPVWWDWGYVRGGDGNLSSQMQGPRVTGSANWNRGWSFVTVSQKLVDELAGDPRLPSIVLMEADLDGTLVRGYQHTGYFSRKYTSDAEHWGSDGQFEHNRTTNNRVIRFSDVLLMAAELGSPNAQQYLDRVRTRAGVPTVTATFDNIYRERHLELALEGHRYFDVLRRGIDYASQELSITGNRGPNYIGDQQIFEVSFNPATRGFLPIPQEEIDLVNGAFEQNQGY